jgi:hypothetical protein
MTTATALLLGREITSGELTCTDLTNEAAELEAKGEPIECYNLVSENSQGFIETVGKLLYVPNAGRAGICRGGDSQWTDAVSAEDAVRRCNDDEMVN